MVVHFRWHLLHHQLQYVLLPLADVVSELESASGSDIARLAMDKPTSRAGTVHLDRYSAREVVIM